MFEYKPDTIVEKAARYIATAVKKIILPEEDDEEAAYDRADDLVRSSFLKPSYQITNTNSNHPAVILNASKYILQLLRNISYSSICIGFLFVSLVL